MQKIKDFFLNIKNKIVEKFTDTTKVINNPNTGYGDHDEGGAASSDGSTIIFTETDTAQLRESAGRNTRRNIVIPDDQLHAKTRSFSASFKKKESRPIFLLGVILTTAKVAMIAIVVIGIACIGAVFGVANAYLGTTPELDLEQLQDNDLTSYIYDGNGTLITSYVGVENRDYASLDEIPDILEKAFISIEDVRFEHHNGIDLKRILKALVSNFTSDRTSGGSTITQQLIKNQLLTSERSYKRKIQEANLAIQLEKKYSKDQILEAYLNSIPLGGLNYGVKAAAKDYFGKELDELTLRETACLAGITKSPYSYDPRRCYYGDTTPEKLKSRQEALNTRIDTVLYAMYQAEYISRAEYDAAIKEQLQVVEKSTVTELYKHPHFVEYAIDNVTEALLEYRNLEDTSANRQVIKNELCSKGYNIYTTIDPEMQQILEEEAVNYTYPKLKNSSDNTITKTINGAEIEVIQPQTAAVIIDQSTGHVKAMIGSRTPPTIKKSTNLATENFSQVGSSIKPLAVYGPALDSGLGLGTMIENIKVPIQGWDTKEGYPTTSHGQKSVGYGPVSIRNGIKHSLNIVAARTLMDHVGVETAYEYMEKLVMDSSALNKDPIGMTLGTSGISTLDMAAAFSAISNGGIYNEPVAFTEITDRYGNTVLHSKDIQESYRVYEESTAYMLVSAMTEAVKSGTGTKARIDGITVAGKTGTNAKNRGVFFAGMTGYYTSAVWIGHEYFKELESTSGGSGAAPLWQAYMSRILEGKEDKAILNGSANSYGVSEYRICAVSGMLATDACDHDVMGRTPITDLYPSSAALENCTMHKPMTICSVSGQMANQYCPDAALGTGSIVVLPIDSEYLKLTENEVIDIFGNVIISSGVYIDPSTGETTYGTEELLSRDAMGNITRTSISQCTVHNYDWYLNNQALASAIEWAQSVIENYNEFISSYSILLSDAQLYELNTYNNSLQSAISTSDANAIINAANALDAMMESYRIELENGGNNEAA